MLTLVTSRCCTLSSYTAFLSFTHSMHHCTANANTSTIAVMPAVLTRRVARLDQPDRHHRFTLIGVFVELFSTHGSASPCARAGEVHSQCFTSVTQCAGAQIWCRLANASRWISRRLRLGLENLGFSGLCSARPLRPPAALLHNAAFCEVVTSHCAKASFCVAYRFAPSRVHKTGVMQSGLRWC